MLLKLYHKLGLKRQLFLKLLLFVSLTIIFGYTVIHKFPSEYMHAAPIVNLSGWSLFIIVVVLVLMPLNIAFEALKWKVLLVQEVHIKDSFKAVLCGMAMQIITPLQVGDFIGRAYVSKSKTLSIAANILSSFGQNIINLTFGLFALVVVCDMWVLAFIERGLLILLAGCTSLGLVIIYFNLERIGHGFKHYISRFADLKGFNLKQKTYVLMLSTLKYLTYLTQFILLLQIISVEASLVDQFGAVALIFLMQSLLPLPFLLSTIARFQIAVMSLAFVNVPMQSALLISGIIWTINIAIPALLGYFSISNHTFQKLKESAIQA